MSPTARSTRPWKDKKRHWKRNWEAQLRTQIMAGTRNVVYTVYAPTGIDAQTVQRHL